MLPVTVNVPPTVRGVEVPVMVSVSPEISNVVELAIFSELNFTLVEVETLVEAVAVTTAPKSWPEVASLIAWADPLLNVRLPQLVFVQVEPAASVRSPFRVIVLAVAAQLKVPLEPPPTVRLPSNSRVKALP